jgi:predicted MFS family arabinose efflux permease
MHDDEGIAQHTAKNLFSRDFILGFLTAFFSAAALHSLTPTLPIYLTRLGSNERETGVLIGTFAVASLASRLFVGGALLKYRAKRVMMFGAFLSVISFFASIVLRPFWPFFIIRILQGVTLACIDTAVLTSVINIIPLAHRTRALGYLMLAPSLALSVAAPLGMFLINQYSFTVLFLFGAGLSCCSLSMSWKVKEQETTIDRTVTPARSAFCLDPKVIVPSITAFLQFFVWGALMAFFPLYAIRCGVSNPGLFFSASAIMMVAGRMFGGKIMDTCNREKFIVTFLSAVVVLLTIISLSRTLSMFIVVGSFWGIGTAFFVPVSMAYSLEHSGPSSGTAVGTFRALQDLGLGLGPVGMGTIIPFTGYRVMFLFLALISLINLCYFQFYVRRRRNVAPTA